MSKKQYEESLNKRQQEHLENINKDFQPCLHDSCEECVGTGKKENGSTCVHWISCPCPKCTPTY